MSRRSRLTAIVLSVILVGMMLGTSLAQGPAPAAASVSIGSPIQPSLVFDVNRAVSAVTASVAPNPPKIDREVSETNDFEKHAVSRRAGGSAAVTSVSTGVGRRRAIDRRGPNVATKQVLRN